MMPSRFHQTQYLVAAAMCLAFGLLYTLASGDRADALLGLATTAAGFCFGKFSNGFRRLPVDDRRPVCPYTTRPCASDKAAKPPDYERQGEP